MKKLLVAALLALHGMLALNAARQLSPVWDEICYPGAGYSALTTGAIPQQTLHPPLAQLFYALPLLPLNLTITPLTDPFHSGYSFVFENTVPPEDIIIRSRLIALLFSLGTALLLYIWLTEAAGGYGGLAALFCYAVTPIFLARASLALLEAPAYFFVTLSFYLHWRWRQSWRVGFLVASAVSAGLALATKLFVIPVMLGLILLTPKREWTKGLLFFVGMWAVFVVLFLPFHNSLELMRHAILNIGRFNQGIYYWHGKLLERAPGILTWAAFFLKAPLLLLTLTIVGAWGWLKLAPQKSAWLYLLVLAIFPLLAAAVMRQPVSTVQISIAYVGLCGIAGGIHWVWLGADKKNRIVCFLLLLLLPVETLRSHPNYLSFFNFAAGDSTEGWRWLAHSDQDWGQSLPALATYLRQNQSPHLVLCYSGAARPESYGIEYQDLFSPSLGQGAHIDRNPVSGKRTLLAVSTTLLQMYPDAFAPLLNHRPPDDMVGFTFLVWDISDDAQAYLWMADFYRQTDRLLQASLAERQFHTLQTLK